ncbi:MAG: Cd(II)/Pb(II)-responsive transcriptional regulator [Betaproteobacteria bacterium]|nr:Cd(II)/Pb(II)-responsive transcriptional regulator [Betaproteobacteria bacterium]
MKIGELARLAGTNVDTIRYYERDGLLPVPARSEGNYRIYGETHVQRLSFIRRCRSLDMTLDEIRVLLHFKESPQENCTDVNSLLDRHIGHVNKRMQELQELERQLQDLREQCGEARDSAHCGILNGLSQAIVPSGKTASHVQGAHRHAANPNLEKEKQGL